MNSSSPNQTTQNNKLETKSLPILIKDIIFYYVKFYYDKKCKELNTNILNEEQIESFIEEHYTLKQKEIKQYIRDSLKKNLGENYNKMTIENILLEIFNDPPMAKERIKLEIIDYQENHQ